MGGENTEDRRQKTEDLAVKLHRVHLLVEMARATEAESGRQPESVLTGASPMVLRMMCCGKL
jgi:hypothetical protein